MLPITQNLAPQSKWSIKCPYAMKPKYIVVHNTANDASARNEIAYMISNDAQVSFHYAVDDKEIVQGIPDNRNAWHASDGATGQGNRNGIAVEICYSKSGGLRFDKAEENAAPLIAMLMKMYNIPITNVKRHYDFAPDHKYCPHRTMDKGWERFLNMVRKAAGIATTATSTPETKPTTTTKYGVGTPINTAILASSSDGKGQVHRKDHWSGTIGKVIAGARYPYRVDNNGVPIGWTDDAGIDTCPHVPGQSGAKPVSAKPSTSTNKITQEAARWGLKVGTKDSVKNGFYISESATIYGGASYGVKVPDAIKKATTKYTCGGVRYDHGEWWVLANQIMSWVKVSETLV